jgi:hypothetical protein
MILPTDAALFLPISDELLDRVLDESTRLDEAVSGLAVPQIASLIVVQCLCPVEGKRSPRPERLLSDMIDLGNGYVKSEDVGAFVASALHALDRSKIGTGRELLAQARIVLLENQELAHRNYLTAEGRWDGSFNERYRALLLRSLRRIELPSGESRVLTPEQGRGFREFEAQSDECLHIQGYGGIGNPISSGLCWARSFRKVRECSFSRSDTVNSKRCWPGSDTSRALHPKPLSG